MTSTLLRAALFFVAVGLVPRAASAAAVRAVVIDGDRITVGDLAPTLPRELLAIDIGPAPAPGARSQITRDAVAEAIRRGGGDPTLATGVAVRQEVRRAATRLTVEEVREMVRGEVLAQLPLGVDIESIVGLRAVTLATGEVSIAVTLGKLRRSTRANVEIRVDGKRASVHNATVALSGVAKTPVLREELAPGMTVEQDHVTLRDVELDALPEGSITRTDQLIGKRLKVRGRVDAPMRAASTEQAPLVTRGSVVQVIISGPGLRISRRAIAQQDGDVGETIRVKPIDDTKAVMVVTVNAEGHATLGSVGAR